MNDRTWASRAVAESTERRFSSPRLAAWILSVADRSLSKVYGPDYSIRCLQASECIRTLLERLGIRGRVWVGAVCAARAHPGPPVELGWAGFWDKDHHVWLVTEFGELVDLTLSQLHLHPSSARPDSLPIPALWWRPLDEWPPILRYLPTAPIRIQLTPEEMTELDELKQDAERVMLEELHSPDQPPLTVSPILLDIDRLNALDRAGYPWLRACRVFSGRELPWPPWVEDRHAELMRGYTGRPIQG